MKVVNLVKVNTLSMQWPVPNLVQLDYASVIKSLFQKIYISFYTISKYLINDILDTKSLPLYIIFLRSYFVIFIILLSKTCRPYFIYADTYSQVLLRVCFMQTYSHVHSCVLLFDYCPRLLIPFGSNRT